MEGDFWFHFSDKVRTVLLALCITSISITHYMSHNTSIQLFPIYILLYIRIASMIHNKILLNSYPSLFFFSFFMEHRSNAILGQSTCPNHPCCKDQEIDEAIAKAQAGNVRFYDQRTNF